VSARAEGRAPSSQHALFAEPGSNLSLRLVLPAGGTVTGRVADGSGVPVSGALVVVGSRDIGHGAAMVRSAPVQARTDADGAFEAHGVPPGSTPVAARARGFGPQELTVDVVAAATSRVVLTLPPAAAIEGTVLGPDGAPAPSAVVVAGAGEKENPLAPDDLLVTRTRTDERGRYRLEGLAAGTITVAVSAKGLGKTSRTVDAAPGDVVALDVMLPGSLEIAGRVVLEDGTPVEGWSVHGSGLTLQFTDAEGRFTFRDVDDRAYTIEVDERGHHVPCARVEGVRAGDDAVTITVLEADRSRSFASGIVVDPDGRRVRGARVGCFRPDGSTVTSARTDFFGGFRIGPLPAGTYLLGASTDDLPRVWADDLTVAHGETLSIGEIRLRRPGFLELAFRSRSGRTAEGLAIHVRDAAGRHVLRRALPLPSQSQPFLPGKHTVTVQGSGFELVREVEIREGERTAVEIDLDDVR
jgi:protocatechuate 3,4-dioxygenase beta subunit